MIIVKRTRRKKVKDRNYLYSSGRERAVGHVRVVEVVNARHISRQKRIKPNARLLQKRNFLPEKSSQIDTAQLFSEAYVCKPTRAAFGKNRPRTCLSLRVLKHLGTRVKCFLMMTHSAWTITERIKDWTIGCLIVLLDCQCLCQMDTGYQRKQKFKVASNSYSLSSSLDSESKSSRIVQSATIFSFPFAGRDGSNWLLWSRKPVK